MFEMRDVFAEFEQCAVILLGPRYTNQPELAADMLHAAPELPTSHRVEEEPDRRQPLLET